MIEDIKNINIPDYAEFKDASAQLQDMGEKTITANVEIAGGVVPDFSSDWEVEFQGERYIMPLRSPQGSRDNNKLSSSLSLTFRHWAIYQLKRYYFVTLQPIESGTAIADKYEASVNLNLHGFCDLFGQVLKHYYGNAIKVDLNPAWVYDSEPTAVEISYSYIWDVLAEVYNLYGVRWYITGSGHSYTIKFGYPTNEVAHIFEHGFNGGLLKIERQVQNDNIRNRIVGRGSTENLPYRYFKQTDENNDTFSPDPDWIPELANIYFDRLRGATFRSYVQGWKKKHYGWASVNTASKAYAPWAWQKGYTDAKFDPVEYVKDDESIARYGVLLGGYNNDEAKPTIQGIVIDPIGRVDEAVDVEKVLTDDYGKTEEADTVLTNIGEMSGTRKIANNGKPYTIWAERIQFTVDKGKTANVQPGPYTYSAYAGKEDITGFISVNSVFIEVNDSAGNKVASTGISEGTYSLYLGININSSYDGKGQSVTVCFPYVKILDGLLANQTKFKSTWNIWVKNIWQTSQNAGETDVQYAERVWKPILGDKERNEGKVAFSDGMLAFSSDYDFTIVSIPSVDRSKTRNGVASEWRITLGKSDADLETLGVYQPSVERFAEAGDHFYFTGIDMPHLYVVWAEKLLDDSKTDQLNEVKDIKPSWVVSPDKVRIGEAGAAAMDEAQTLLSQLHVGDTIRLADQVFIKDAAYETVYLQSITYNYKSGLNPDVDIVLSNDYAVSANPVEALQGEVNALNKQVGSLSNIEQVVRAVGDKLYLRKDGIGERSTSPTEFLSRIMSGNFRAGIAGGTGWGFYQDENGDWVLETDQVKVRHDMLVNNLVINQISAQGGMVIESAASMTVTGVIEETVTNDDKTKAVCYTCYFDTKNGSVPNLFNIGDIVLCQGFDKDANDKTKYYKRRVFYVGDDYISLFKSSYKKGDDIPEVGDVLVQYGSYSDANRTFVKIRDVVGGGYERYISGLSSVYTEGTEYYFVGRMTGQYYNQGRFFLGTQGGKYIEYKNGDLNISGNIILGAGSSGLENFAEWSGKQEQIDDAVGNAFDAINTAEDAVYMAFNAQISADDAQETANNANTKADNLKYLSEIFPTGNLVASGAVLAKFLGVMDGNNVVAGINGSNAITGDGGKLMLFAGASSLANANNATTRIYENGDLYCNSIHATSGYIGPFKIMSNPACLDTSGGNLFGAYLTISKDRIDLNGNKGTFLADTSDTCKVLLISGTGFLASDANIDPIFNIIAKKEGKTAIYCTSGDFAGLRPRTRTITSETNKLTFADNVIIARKDMTIVLPYGSSIYKGHYFDIHGYVGFSESIGTITIYTIYNNQITNLHNGNIASSITIKTNESVRLMTEDGKNYYMIYLHKA